jgi:predicted nucleic acid-binding Zn ribbon protein
MEAFLEALVTLARRTRNKALIAFTTIAAIVVMMVVWYVALRAG